MKMFTTDEEAVSPVIGVILMVAIVVILAAVIAAFVFGMAGSTGTAKNVGMTVSLNGTTGLDIVWQGGTDINSLDFINVSVGGTAVVPTKIFTDEGPYKVGNITYIESSHIIGNRTIITGTFTDGSTQVLFDRRY